MNKFKQYSKLASLPAGFLLSGCFMLPTAEAHHHHSENVAIVLPLTGPDAAVSAQLRRGALLGLNDPKAHHTTVIDLNRIQSIDELKSELNEDHVNIVIGPLLSEETQKLAPLAKDGDFVFSLTSDDRTANPHEWVMGITPLQQVKPLISLAMERIHEHFAAFLPDNDYGHAMGDAFVEACHQLGANSPNVIYHGFSNAAIEEDFTKLVQNDGETLPFDTLFLGDTGTGLNKVIHYLPKYRIDSRNVQIMGPTSWQLQDGSLGAIADAWYAAPNEIRSAYRDLYQKHFSQNPASISMIAYDAGLLANNIHKDPNIVSSNEGFNGLSGWFRLSSDGHVERNLDVYKILASGGAGRIVQNKTQTAATLENTDVSSNDELAAPSATSEGKKEVENDGIAVREEKKETKSSFWKKLGF